MQFRKMVSIECEGVENADRNSKSVNHIFHTCRKQKTATHRRQNAFFLGSTCTIGHTWTTALSQGGTRIHPRQRHVIDESKPSSRNNGKNWDDHLRNQNYKKVVHFSNSISVTIIPNRRSYSSFDKAKLWTDRMSMHFMIKRNNFEYRWEQTQLAGHVVEEINFEKIGNCLVHPAHVDCQANLVRQFGKKEKRKQIHHKMLS